MYKKLISQINLYVIAHNLLLKQILEGKIGKDHKPQLKKFKTIIDNLRGELNDRRVSNQKKEA
jgi:hypothetical protein